MQNEKHKHARKPEHLGKHPSKRQSNNLLDLLGLAISVFMLTVICASFRVPDARGPGGSIIAGDFRLTREVGEGGDQPGQLERLPGGYRESAERSSPPVGEFDLDRLAKAVALHETVNCRRGVGVTHNNCHGLRENGEFITFPTPGMSYHSFRLNWIKHYGNHFPTYDDAVKYSGGDRADAWLANVTKFY